MMQVNICAVGRLRAGPEKALVDDYLARFDRTGRGLGLGPAKVIEVEDKRGSSMAAEAELLEQSVPKGSIICVMDERGKVMTSPEFTQFLADWRDQGQSAVSFIIGGADGIEPKLQSRADARISFGRMVWPHMLARVMLSEQLYRAASILANKPYHRS